LILLISAAAVHLQSLTFGTTVIVVAIAVLPNPATAGVQYVTHELARGEAVFLSDQWDGLRRFSALALRAWLLSLLVTVVILANIALYLRAHFPLALPLALIWLYILVVWLAALVYVYPLIVEQRVRRVLLVYRNAFIMAASRPMFTIVTLLLWLAVLLLTAGTTGIVVVGLAIGAAIQQNAAAALLPTLSHVEDQPGK
jgi:uncharacterized membrane protein YesL